MRSLSEIKKIRKSLGLTQKKLAHLSGVSQSLIAKIEAGRIDPTYSKVTRIFSTLDSQKKSVDITAESIMNRKMITLRPEDSLKRASHVMKIHNISQIPVKKDQKIIGLLSESNFVDAIKNGFPEISPIEKIMGDAPPVITPKAGIDIISNLLKFYPLIIIEKKGHSLGIITKSDILTKLYK